MTTYIALLPGIVAVIYLFWAGEERAFRNIYIPVLLMLPQIFSADLHGFPDLNTSQAAIIPIALYTLTKYILWWRWSLMDFFIALFIFICCLSEFFNTGDQPQEGNLTIALLADLLFDVFFPYILAKALIHPRGRSVDYARKIAFIMTIVVCLTLYEMRFVSNPFLEWPRVLFPGQGLEWPTLYRMGLVRVGGPFIQTILFGLGLAVAFVLNYWLTRGNKWGTKLRELIPIPFSQGWIYGAILLFGILMTISRGPILAAFTGLLIATVGFAKRRRTAILWRILLLTAGALLGYGLYSYYSELSTTLSSDWTATAAYRAKLWDRYSRAVLEKPLWGWGFTTWPKDITLQSIDNEYLFLVMKHGFMALACFLLPILWQMGRLLWRGMTFPYDQKDNISLSFTLLGAQFTIMSAILTVFLGLQLQPLLFLLIGWVEGFLLTARGNRV